MVHLVEAAHTAKRGSSIVAADYFFLAAFFLPAFFVAFFAALRFFAIGVTSFLA